jgi:hypothetical protein
MRILRLTFLLGAILAMATSLDQAHAQIVTGSANGHHFGPFIEPDSFRPDFQFFAPADVTDYNPRPDAPTGFFFTYDRVYMNVTRPESAAFSAPSSDVFVLLPPQPDVNVFATEPSSIFDGDFTWGNRLELGFMNEDDHGWSIVGWHIDGPNQNNNFEQGDRLAFIAEVNEIPGTTGITDDAGGIIFPDPDDFNLRFQDSISDAPLRTDPLAVGSTVNEADYSSIEINKVLTRHYFHGGGVIEPLVGFRYARFTDIYQNRQYLRGDFSADGEDDSEIYTVNRTNNENNMLGGQLGFRLFKETGHWTLSSELRMFGFANFQMTQATIDEYWWLSADGPRGTALSFQRRESAGVDNSEFVWGGDLKLEAEYKLTRDIGFRTGFVFMDLAQGISRGATFQSRNQQGNLEVAQSANDQDVQMFGLTFGVDINR